DVGTFTRLAFRVPGKLYLKQGSPQKGELEGPSDVLKEIETELDGDRLVIGKENHWRNWGWKDSERIVVYVTVKDISGISVSGSGSLDVEVVATGNMEADVSGSGDINLKGSCTNYDSDVSGSGKIVLNVVVREQADFGVSGSGERRAEGSAREMKTSISGS